LLSMNNKILLLIILCYFLFWTASVFADQVATDPSRIGVGARVLGMGKGYVGLADDLSGIFINPSALATVSNLQMTSMSGKFINEYNYVNFGAAVPTNFGGIGIGYVTSGISFLGISTTIEVIDGVRIVPVSSEGQTYSFNNSVFLLSWGRELEKISGLRMLNYFSVGATWKIFALNLSGPSLSGATASGSELDIALNYNPSTIFSAGLVIQNVLPGSTGGKITWANGTEENLSSIIKTGISFRLLGEEGLRRAGNHELILNLDYDFAPLRPALPTLIHTGLEWTPITFLSIRMGIDQDYVGSGVGLVPGDDFTAGVGLNLRQFRFDYAFHQYNKIAQNTTHYFSLTYGVTKDKYLEVKEESISVNLEEQGIVYSEVVTFEGELLTREIRTLSINDVEIPIRDRKFIATVRPRLGKNSFVIFGHNRRGEIVENKVVKMLRLKTFGDIGPGHWAKEPIEQIATLGVMEEVEAGLFMPDEELYRADALMDMLRVKKVATEEVVTSPFTDVKAKDWVAPFVAAGHKTELVKGYPDLTFRPWNSINRVEGVIMATRLSSLDEPDVQERPYEDIMGRYWAIKEITAAKQAGYLSFVLENFYPKQMLTRAEDAVILSKSKYVSKKIDEMMNWGEGY